MIYDFHCDFCYLILHPMHPIFLGGIAREGAGAKDFFCLEP